MTKRERLIRLIDAAAWAVHEYCTEVLLPPKTQAWDHTACLTDVAAQWEVYESRLKRCLDKGLIRDSEWLYFQFSFERHHGERHPPMTKDQCELCYLQGMLDAMYRTKQAEPFYKDTLANRCYDRGYQATRKRSLQLVRFIRQEERKIIRRQDAADAAAAIEEMRRKETTCVGNQHEDRSEQNRGNDGDHADDERLAAAGRGDQGPEHQAIRSAGPQCPEPGARCPTDGPGYGSAATHRAHDGGAQ